MVASTERYRPVIEDVVDAVAAAAAESATPSTPPQRAAPVWPHWSPEGWRYAQPSGDYGRSTGIRGRRPSAGSSGRWWP
ncbi:hypothetical protein I553_3719 [Mycobacterium xenopi 4042]|uniref:Uncharacterized protein n=1 Tax=Mycobacterium xenopi 4042 TaxID=1299334 RepID=X7YTB5_MYCXE|nr:hypothetical protein I553_3719 [Mycobacterium xenopi 4042]